MERKLILMSVKLENCPIQPPRPGNYWVGYTDLSEEEIQAKLVADGENARIQLTEAWLIQNGYEVVIQSNPNNPAEKRHGLSQFCNVLPFSDCASVKGEDITVPITSWLWPSETTVTNIKAMTDDLVRQIIQNRSNLITAQVDPRSLGNIRS
jgi:hypothetical protein